MIKDSMKLFPLLALLLLSACSTPAGQASFWTQKVQLNAIGINIVTEFGLINIGSITWSRNVENPPEVEKLMGVIKAAPLPPWTPPEFKLVPNAIENQPR